jgi:orotidine-5'-phosphate decarboxylase
MIRAMENRDRLVVALDRSSRDEILRLADALRGRAGMLKIGLQAFVANGPSIVRELVVRGEKVFLDLKFHDIPNTASHAVAEALQLGCSIVNVHASGGRAMMRACRDVVPADSKAIVLGVTVLTSLASDDLAEIGMHRTVEESVVALARMAKEAGLHGVVASPLEISRIRDECGAGFVILTPGIRSATDAAADQKRTMTAREAIRAGADYIVVGRPVTGAKDPAAAADAIIASI